MNDPLPEQLFRPRMEQAWAERDRDRAGVRALLAEFGVQTARPEVEVLRAYLAWREGRYEEALSATEPVIQGRPDLWLLRALSIRGCTLMALGDDPASAEALHTLVRLSRQLNALAEEATGLHDLGALHLERDPEHAWPYLRAARELALSAGDQPVLAHVAFNLGRLALHHQDAIWARGEFEEALRLARACPLPHVEAAALAQLGRLALRAGRRDEAEALLRGTLALWDPAEFLLEDVFAPLTTLLLDTGRAEEAQGLLTERLHRAQTAQARPQQTLLHAALSEVHEHLGDPAAALAHLKASTRLFKELHAEHQERQIRALEVLHRTGIMEREAAAARTENLELGAAVERLALLHQQAEQRSLTDELTGLHNRRFLLSAGEELAGQASPEHPLGLAVLDLDHFKAVNDTYGHDQGDEVLREFADLLRHSVRTHDVAVRSGGEEFVVLFPDTAAEAAFAVLERLRVSLAAYEWRSLPSGERLTFTAGVDVCLDGQLLGTLHRADKWLYQGKNTGRDTIRHGLDGQATPTSGP